MDFFTIAATAIAAMAGGWIFSAYSRARADAREDAGRGALLVDTDAGPIEYSDIGEGPVVLLSHGGGGGCDHGFVVAPFLDGFRCITPSRFGYLRAPLPGDATAAAQADAHAALLRSLEIKHAAIIASSGGGPSALHFAAKYPGQCRALVMISGISQPLQPFRPMTQLFYNALCSMDFIAWLMYGVAGPSIVAAADTTAVDRKKIQEDPSGYARMLKVCRMAPTHLRRRGLINDTALCRIPENFACGDIAVPSLIIHGTSDPIVPVSHARDLAEKIKSSEFMEIAEGGHLCIISRRKEIFPRVEEFIKRNMQQKI